MSDFVDPPYGPFIVGHGATIRGQVLEKTDGGDEAGKDISNARWVVRLRSRARGSSTIIHNEVLDKSSTNSATGYFDHYLTAAALGATAYTAALTWEEVLVDTSTNDASTPTGYAERLLRRWRQPLEDAAPAA